MAFKILMLLRDGEGIHRHVPPPGYEHHTFAAVEQAAGELVDVLRSPGLVVDMNHQIVCTV